VQKRTAWGMPLVVTTIWQIGLGMLPIMAVALASEVPHLAMPGWQAIAIVLFVGLISQAIGMSTWFAIVDLVPAHVAGLSTVSVPVVAVFSGAIILGEPLGWMQWLALAAIVSALSLVLVAPARS
jgi:drug/metabolite transporter (DMT)-like permease